MDRKSQEYKDARKSRRIARKAKVLGNTVEEYLARQSKNKVVPLKGTQLELGTDLLGTEEDLAQLSDTTPSAKPDIFTEIEAREKQLKKLATSAMAKRLINKTGKRLTDRQEIIRALLVNEFEDEQNEGFVEAYFTSK